ncbi:MAG: SGNH/GDSL hydrolase family protein [Dermatophilaceae bacterium]
MTRFVAVGDSLTEGAGDPHPRAPNGLRGWADLLAGHLAAADPATEYANLALRGRRAGDILRHQVPVAVTLRPTVVTVWSGGNDLLRPYTDVDDVARTMDETVGRLVGSSARVLVLTSFECSPSPLLRLVSGRIRRLNECLRRTAAQHGAEIVDVADFGSWSAAPMLCQDRVHPSPLGHRLLADRVAHVLGVPAPLDTGDELVLATDPTGRSGWLEEARWWCRDVGPHLVRWLTDASSRDGATAKWAAPVRVADLTTTAG